MDGIKCSLLFGIFLVTILSVSSQRCYSPNGANGRCTSVYQCNVIYKIIESRTISPETRQFLQASQCQYGSGRPPFVCCAPDDSFIRGGGVYQPQTQFRKLPSNGQGNVLPEFGVCGPDSTGNKIYGGEGAELDEFPWMALLEYRNQRGERDFSCGGVLINQRYVLTVAHCLTGQIILKKGKLINVRLGEYNLDSQIDCTSGRQPDCAPAPLDIAVEQTIAHPQYNDNNLNRYNDIGLVRLAFDATYSDFVKPICLPSANLRSAIGHTLIVSGWGRTLTMKRASIKQKLPIQVSDFDECRRLFMTKGVTIGDTQFCAGGEYAQDSCDGDSGGPLMKQSNGFWVAEGLVSFGRSCGLEGWPGIYTRVASFRSWITDNMSP